MEGFFNLISHFQTQSEPAYCGLATLAMVLNALAIDPCRKWKGNYFNVPNLGLMTALMILICEPSSYQSSSVDFMGCSYFLNP